MKGATQGGFTIVEVMMVLAVSAVILLSAITVFNGKREDTFFTQAVYDLRSELQTIANNVSSQSVPGLQLYKCQATDVGGTMRPVLSAGSQTGQDCIYMGQAIQVAPNATTLYSWPVFGLRTVWNGATDTGASPLTVTDAHPHAAVNATSPDVSITYNLMNSLKVVSATFSGSDNYLLTMYSSLQDTNTSGNEINVSAQNYNGSSTDPANQISDCVHTTDSSHITNCTLPSAVNNSFWKLCVQYASKQAQISLKGTPTGIVTQLNLNGCS